MFIKKQIVWEKWVDPLNRNIDEVEYPGYNFPSYEEERPIEFISSDPEFEEKFEEKLDGGEDIDDIESHRPITYNPIRIASTPHGFISMTEHSYASKHFDFWTMHYTHDITPKIKEVIEECAGVETLEVITRYRARIGFNRTLIKCGAISLPDIKKNIEKKILESEPDEDIDIYDKIQLHMFSSEVTSSVLKIKSEIEKNKYWAIYTLPNGCSEFVYEQNSITDGLMETVEIFKQTEKLIGGKLLVCRELRNEPTKSQQ